MWNVLKFLNETPYVQSLERLNILAEAIDDMEWQEFWHCTNKERLRATNYLFKSLQNALSFKKLFDECLPAMLVLNEEIEKVQKITAKTSK